MLALYIGQIHYRTCYHTEFILVEFGERDVILKMQFNLRLQPYFINQIKCYICHHHYDLFLYL